MTFGDYLKQLRKNKSISQRELAEHSGISNAEISRIETGARQKPAPDLLRTIAPILGVPYEELMDKAGYLNGSSNFLPCILTRNRELTKLRQEMVSKFVSAVTPKLIMDGWSIGLVKQDQLTNDMVIAKRGNEEWHIIFICTHTREDTERHFRDNIRAQSILWQTYGKLAIYAKGIITKATIVLNNERFYEVFLKSPPRQLNFNVSLMLIDLENNKVAQEHQFCKEQC